ncbi:nicotinate-nucleotide adenylyltransferase [Alkalimonas mucilaginosa]|uniref:Probable nicotinate-nucleotide adenylyltransferase n=1 Tax=Alkalimonas mucilaginosa TaxID=3057676 RepID=A0ABU7JAP8_9GAMM|nr:nicotinate-nucleotide adenylyltransferase [Alkalimonas sp. MEB004]MEE2022769.1 nicotinate-nucleotide adenylyltransferase [Alkalimonas sp. MEB004]
MNTTNPLLGIFGGTFDPIHYGHLRTALHVQQTCQLEQVRLMPCHLPAHRASPGVSAVQRAEMVQLAIAPYPQLALEPLELRQHRPSYSAISLAQLKQQYPKHQLAFILGMDAFNQFTRWHRWQQILQLADLIVCQRPDYEQLSAESQALLVKRQLQQPQDLQQRGQGRILVLENPLLAVSASQLRAELPKLASCPEWLPSAVWNYIRQHELYTSRVTSQP